MVLGVAGANPVCSFLSLSGQGESLSLSEPQQTKLRLLLVSSRRGREEGSRWEEEKTKAGAVAAQHDGGLKMMMGFDVSGSERRVRDNDDELYIVACSPTDATLVATGGGDDKGFFWRINRGDWASEIQGHKDSVSSLAFSTDGQLLASGGFDGLVQIWDTSSGILKCALDGPGGGIEWVRWHPRGHIVLAGSEDSTVWMWNADRGAYLNMFSGHGSSVTCGDFTPDGKTICTGSDDATLRIWNPKSGENNHVIRGHPYHTEGLTCLTISSDSTLALTGSKDGSVNMVNITTGKVVSSLVSHTDSIECIAFAPSSPWAATGSMDQKLIIWDLQHSSPRSTCDHEEGVTCLTWLGTSRYLITVLRMGKYDCMTLEVDLDIFAARMRKGNVSIATSSTNPDDQFNSCISSLGQRLPFFENMLYIVNLMFDVGFKKLR
ncbi:hypothetical protein LWI28_025051 [Acer negundo]|uniref:Angio-associated migratory cell protein n=1 Tax=Acer negundo TaxID=4023 RepID=A0AAD5P6B0_ACENE|nr:hypothetical protein LWI28_025051 [Acer negundo]